MSSSRKSNSETAPTHTDITPIWMHWAAGPFTPSAGLLFWERMTRAQLEMHRQIADAVRDSVRRQQDALFGAADKMLTHAAPSDDHPSTAPEALTSAASAMAQAWRRAAEVAITAPIRAFTQDQAH